ncbi:ABC transporter permease [Sulfurimonas paralvinellae]|uniref:FtsX-like permease family protein n=1 Tax=Sulfurimonas paralvinellae TaxID=317658 RepID=A0A7M1B8I3_9BACT|nr:FtsX-like permease family protein [Sulfurimonas paralvinellae]QOP45995.1 FtsX-like permease family protein [Sulfurimonas paralvinellae]
MSKINFYLLEYAYAYILRYKSKNFFIVTVFTLLVALLSSLFFTTSSIEYELRERIKNQPDILVQNYQAGKPAAIDAGLLDKLLEIDGISSGRTRVEGTYYFRAKDKNFYIVGVDPFETQSDPFIQKLLEKHDINESSMLVSINVKKAMKQAYYKEYFNFVKPDGELLKVSLADSFDVSKRVELQNLILMQKETAQKIFGYHKNQVTDIALSVANKNELDFIASKIRLLLPNAKVVSKNDLSVKYEKLFDYDNGVFLSLFIIALFTFFVIVYDKANGLSSEEKREIGILKALGWRVEDVLHAKFYEASLLSLFSFILGVALAYIYVFLLKAPLLGSIFTHENLLDINSFTLNVHIDMSYILLIFLLSVPVYIAATLIPSWRVATLDADEVMR